MHPHFRHHQKGQALIYGLFVMTAGIAGLFFLFNTGQLAYEKSKLVNTADAVAYSGGIMNARALNFQAYTNRAMIANTVAIAQLVSLSSWVSYAQVYGQLGETTAFNPKYYGSLLIPYSAAAEFGAYLNSTMNESGTVKGMAAASDTIVQALMVAQKTAYLGLLPARKTLMQEVADANYKDDGTVEVGKIPLMVNEFTSFSTQYAGNQRTRFADLAQTAAKKDPFVAGRSWRLPSVYPDCVSAWPRVDWINRRGGTELIGLDEWRAADSQSEWRWVPRSKWDVFCQGLTETPQGWGGTSAATKFSYDFDLSHYDAALANNPTSATLAQVSTRDWNYSGLPSFYDLTQENLNSAADPKMLMAITLSRATKQTKTSEGRSAIQNTQRLNAYQANTPKDDSIVAVSASEVFFQRDGESKDNVYGMSIGKPQELANLFNPYWQIRLVQSEDNIRKAQALQGVILP